MPEPRPNPLLVPPHPQVAPGTPVPADSPQLTQVKTEALVAGGAISVATSKDDLKAGVGSLALAVVAPKEGPIEVAPGTPVVVVAKHLWDSPTVKKFRNAVIAGWGAFAAYVVVQVIVKGGPFALVSDQWLSLLKDATYPALLTAAGIYGINVKRGDNDPTVK